MTAMKDLVDYLRKSPSVVYPAEVLEYAMPAEAECAWLRELASDYMHANERLLTELKRYEGIVRARHQDPVPHLVNEVARLRELLKDALPLIWLGNVDCSGCLHMCECYAGESTDYAPDNCRLIVRAKELGIEVE